MTNEKDIRKQIISLLTKDIETIQSSKLNGFMKLWLYQFYALSHLSWPFLINDLDKSFSLDLQRMRNRQLKAGQVLAAQLIMDFFFVPRRILG